MMTALTPYFTFVPLLLIAAAVQADTGMRIVTADGHVEFTVGDDWPVIAMQSRLPVAAAGFQLPNAADDGTPDSTNLAITLCDPNDKNGREVCGRDIDQHGSATHRVEVRDGWIVTTQKARQGETEYSVIDAKRQDVVGLSVWVRFAWPHLPDNPSTYDAAMDATLRQFLASVKGHRGPWTPGPHDVIRRPAP